MTVTAPPGGMPLVFVGAPPLQDLPGGHWPEACGWLLATPAIPAVLLADAVLEAFRARHKHPPAPSHSPLQ